MLLSPRPWRRMLPCFLLLVWCAQTHRIRWISSGHSRVCTASILLQPSHFATCTPDAGLFGLHFVVVACGQECPSRASSASEEQNIGRVLPTFGEHKIFGPYRKYRELTSGNLGMPGTVARLGQELRLKNGPSLSARCFARQLRTARL